MIDEARARFLAAIAAHLPVERVAEVHLFGAIRQGGMESGVAVLALELPEEPAPAAVAEGAPETAAPEPAADEAAAELDAARGVAPEASHAGADAGTPGAATAALGASGDAGPSARSTPAAARFTVYTARYRHTLKGLDRGKYEVSVTEEALAPLLTVDAVVRGVQRRSGDADETMRLSGEEFRSALPAAPAAR